MDEKTKEIAERLTRLIGEGRDYDEDTEAMIVAKGIITSLSERVGELEGERTNEIATGFVNGMKYAEKLVRFREGIGTNPEAADYIKQHIDGTGRMNGCTGLEAGANYARALSKQGEGS